MYDGSMATYEEYYASEHLPEMIDRVLAGEEVIIARQNMPVVRLTRMRPYGAQKERRGGTAKGQISVAPDFDAPLPDFDDYS